jgi:hypothetical protein
MTVILTSLTEGVNSIVKKFDIAVASALNQSSIEIGVE